MASTTTVLALLAVALSIGPRCVEEAPIDGASCNPEHPCPDGFACTAGACGALEGRPPGRCHADEDCPIGVCLEAAGFCVQCQDDTDCGQVACIPDQYVCGCRQDTHCATGRCDEPSGVCVSCYADEQCGSGICDQDNGTCQQLEADGEGIPDSKGRAGGSR